MPPSIPTTSSVAVATARILEAYLSNHRLSPAEAASLSGRITDALDSLTNNDGGNGQTTTWGEPPQRRAKFRKLDQSMFETEPTAQPEFDHETDPEVEPEAEPEPEPELLSEPDAQLLVETAPMTEDAEPEDFQVPVPEPIEVQQPEAEGPPKRKRPSRPRSKRGQGLGKAAAPDATSGVATSGEATTREATSGGEPENEEPENEALHDDERPTEAAERDEVAAAEEASLVPEPVAAEGAPEGAAPQAKPRRATSRARRVTAS